MKRSEVPGYQIVEDKIRTINDNIIVKSVNYDPKHMAFKFILTNNKERDCEVILSGEFLDDLNDYRGNRKSSNYWRNLDRRLTSTLLAPIEKYGLTPFEKEKLKELIFEHVKNELQRVEHVNKFNLLGAPHQQGSLERALGVEFDELERADAGIAFDELRAQGVLIPTYKDLISPYDWVKIRDKDKSIQAISISGPKEDITDIENGDLEKGNKIPIDAIFLSSTIENLRDCRIEVAGALKLRGIKVISSESPDFAGILRENLYDICIRNVSIASHFIIILDRKYGELYNGKRYKKFKDISITHAEFKKALEDKEKPILFYVRNSVWHDYKTWKKNPNLNCDTDHRVFRIIKDFEDKEGHISSFNTSVELKSMILERLGID